MKIDSALKSGISKREVFSLAKDALDNGGIVRAAHIRSGLATFDHNYKEVKKFEYDEGICIQHNGNTSVYFSDRYADRPSFVEVNLKSEDVCVRLGNSLNETGFNNLKAYELRKAGQEVNPIREELSDEVLVENGRTPTDVQIELRNNLLEMNKKFGTPKEISIPDNRRSNNDYKIMLIEIKKLHHSLDGQYQFAKENDAMPKYPSFSIDMTSDAYKQFKRDVAKNVARSHAQGMLFSIEEAGENGLSISVQAPDGKVIGSLNMDSILDAETLECDMTIGEPIEIEVKSIPDISSMSQKGLVTDNFRELVSEMRKDFALISPVTQPGQLVSGKDINNAVSGVFGDISNAGKSPIVLKGSHPDILSAKLTYALSKKYPEIIKDGMQMIAEKKEQSFSEDYSPPAP